MLPQLIDKICQSKAVATDCTSMEKPVMVPKNDNTVSCLCTQNIEVPIVNNQESGATRTNEKLLIQIVCLNCLRLAGPVMPLFLDPSTLPLYNRLIRKLNDHCFKRELDFPKCSVSTVFDFLRMIADSSHQPKSQLKCALAAMSHLFEVIDHVNITGQ